MFGGIRGNKKNKGSGRVLVHQPTGVSDLKISDSI